jgi:phosphoglycerate dehydrogenase-like enzyme
VTESRPIGNIVVAYPWNADDEMLAPLRAQLPDLDIVAQPYYGQFAHHVPGASDSLSDDERALWGRAEVAMALDVPKGIAEVAPNLRWIQAIGAGIDHLLDADLPDRVVITNAAGVAAAPIAEFAMGRLLAVWKQFSELDEQQRNRDWKPIFGSLAEGQTLGVIGLGAIGTAVAVRARAFGMATIGTRRSYRPGDTHPTVDELKGADDLHEVLGRCDAVVVSAPGTPETENLFDAAAFAAMKPGAIFCNVGRGSLVDEVALVDVLESGHVGAAILDVTRQEPMPADDPLWDAPNIYISPHCSTSQDRYTDKLFELFADNLGRYSRGEELRNVVDLTAGY